MDRLTNFETLPPVGREEDPGQWSVATALAVVVSLADELEPGTPERRTLARAAMILRPALKVRRMTHARRWRRELEGRLRGGRGPTAATVAPGFTFILYQASGGIF